MASAVGYLSRVPFDPVEMGVQKRKTAGTIRDRSGCDDVWWRWGELNPRPKD